MANDYGQQVAMRRARAKAAKKKQDVGGPPKPPKEKKRTATKMTTHPMRSWRGKTTRDIDWSFPGTDNPARTLAERLSGSRRMQLLHLPPGFGKTAIAVATLGAMQEKAGRQLPVIVVTARSILNQGGWQATIDSWNQTHPDNRIDPYLIDTFDRMTRILDFPETLASVCKAMGRDGILVLDEAHSYKNPTSKRSKKMQRLAHLKKLGLSGTPLDNNIPLDSAAYLILAGFYRNKTDFMDRTMLKAHLDYLGQPAVWDDNGSVSTDIWPEYDMVRDQLSEVIYSPDTSTTAAVGPGMPTVTKKLLRLGDDRALDKDLRSLGRAYGQRMFDSVVDYTMEVIRRIYADEKRTHTVVDLATADGVHQPLVFYWNTVVRDALAAAFTAAGVPFQEVSGRVNISQMDYTNNGPVLIQYASGGVGVEFTQSNTSIFAQPQGSYSKMVQARGRNVRRGMDHDVTHWYLIGDQPFDEEIFERVGRREEVSASEINEIALRAGGAERNS